MTLAELGARMSSREFTIWKEFYAWREEKREETRRDQQMFSNLDARAAKAARN